MKEMICAFSSDSRSLYEADIYRVVNLPSDHVVHFRYKKKYVEDALLGKNFQHYGKEVLIVYTAGNAIDLDNKDKTIKNLSIRKASIVDFQIDSETEVCHVYMKLGGFVNASISEDNESSVSPPNKFLANLKLENLTERTWKDCIDEIKEYFENKVFTHIQEIRGSRKSDVIKLKYDNVNRISYYELTQGERYHISLATGNPDINSCKVQLESSSDEVEFHCITPIESSVQYDTQIIPLTIKESSVRASYSTLTFTPTIEELDDDNKKEEVELKEFSTLVEIRSKQSRLTSFFFGLASAFLLAGLGLGRSAIRGEISWLLCILSLVLVTGSAACLHHFFNKK